MAVKYISTSGSDSNPGTITQPWATWNYGFNNISAGDTLYIRGGTYTPTVITTANSRHAAVSVSGKNGTVGSPYQVFAYPGETPILDGRNITATTYERIGIYLRNSSYWHLKGLHVTRVDQPVTGVIGGQGIFIWGSGSATYNKIESCVAHHCGGPGMGTRDSVNETLFLNCDSYENWDPYSGSPGGNADGYDVGYSRGIIRFVGCRAWYNGDDGFDMYQVTGWDATCYLTNCWAWLNGYGPGYIPGGDGSGFKLGSAAGLQSDGTVRRYLYNCISAVNTNNGFDQNAGNMKTNLYSSVAYANGNRGFNFQWQNQADTLRGNISYDNDSADAFQASQTHDHNSWDSGVTVTDADFTSVDETQLDNARTDGTLPVMTFLHLVVGSDLRNAGSSTNIYATDGDGKAWATPNPSIGAFEFGTIAPPVSILVTSITVTGAGGESQISTLAGTLQMIATVLPVNADIKTVTWTVSNETGTATIDSYGVITASSNGTVTVRATAQDGSAVYGELEITISNQIIPEGTGLRDRDGNYYTSVIIGNQEWILENLKTTHYADGTAIPNITDNTIWTNDILGAYCWFNNDISNKSNCGALYNWYAVDNASGLAYLERDGIEEAGWHIPTQAEWNILKTYLELNGYGFGGTGPDIGKSLSSTSGWAISTTPGYVGCDQNTNNETGFNITPCGTRIQNTGAFFAFQNQRTYFWSATNDATPLYPIVTEGIVYNGDALYESHYNQNGGESARLVRDTSLIPPDPPDPPVPPTYPEVVTYNYGAIPEYRFYVTESPSSSTYEVFPLKFLSTTLNSEREGNSIFYRNKFNGSLLFGTNSLVLDSVGVQHNRREDWLLFWGFEQHDPSARIDLTITQEWGGVINIYWEGYFSSSDGAFDIDACTFEVTPHLEDDYTDVLDKADIQRNILSCGVAVSTTAVFSTATVVYTRNRWLMDAIDYLGTDATFGIIPGATISSTFFTDDPNYVTQDTSHLLYLTIAQKSDILRYSSTNPATTALISWNELMDIFWAMFQVKWNYDPLTNTINIEHISWFNRTAGIDLRTQMSTQMTNKYSYLKEKMPKYEKFYFMEADDDNFVGATIWYDSLFVNQNPDENTSELAVSVTTDLEFMYFNPEAIADDGFVILCNYLDTGVYYVEFENGMLIDEVKLNMHLSWANLHHYYFRHERVLIEGYLNDFLTTFISAQKTKKQTCSAIICPDSNYDPSDEITTELGEVYFGGAKAIVEKSQLSPTGEIRFELLYGPPDNEDNGIPTGKFIRIYQDGCCHFHAILSEPADADLDILIQWAIYDYYDSEVCEQKGIGEGVTWTIPMGSLTDDYDLVFEGCDCDELTPTSYIIFESHNWGVIGDPTWIVSFFYDPECERGG